MKKMNEAMESVFSYFLGFIFLAGSLLFFIKFYNQSDPNFYALTIFLGFILLVILFANRIELLELTKDGIKLKLMSRKSKELGRIAKEEEITEKRINDLYQTRVEIKRGV